MIDNLNKVILTDCDGVLMNWEYAFNTWMQAHGYEMLASGPGHYDMGDRYGLTKDKKKELVKFLTNQLLLDFFLLYVMLCIMLTYYIVSMAMSFI